MAASKPAIVPATLAHVGVIAANMRQADVDEVWASSHSRPYEALLRGLDTSTKTWTGLIDDEPICMFGVAPASVLGGIGIPWLLGTDGVVRHQRTFLKHCRPVVADMLAVYTLLINAVDERNTVSQRWLRWLGFTLYEPQPHGPDGMLFRVFELRRQD